MRPITDVLFGIAFSFVVALAGHTLFGEIPGVPLWRVLFFGLASGYVHGYVVASRGGLRVLDDDHDAITPRRHRFEPSAGGGDQPPSRHRLI